MNVIGIFMAGPNTGACLFKDGQLVAMAEEERFCRIKSASEHFPSSAIRYCLKEASLTLKDIDKVALGWNYSKYPAHIDAHMQSISGRDQDPYADVTEDIIHQKLSPDLTLFNIKIALKKIDQTANPEIVWYSHHKCHVASTHYLSNFEESAILVMDGSGEDIATTTWQGRGRDLTLVDEWKLPDSLGWFYAAITEWAGFKAYSGEGKVMGLAAYGNPLPEVAEKLKSFCIPDEEHIYKIDPTYVYYGQRTYSRKFTDKLVDLLGPPRTPESELTQYTIDVAYEAQKRLEDVATQLVTRLLDKTGDKNLCISGGVAMNCKMNGVLSNLPGVDNVFINPASHDSGTALCVSASSISSS